MGESWYFRRSGQQTGPVRFEELRELAGSGELTPDDEVRSGHGYWQEARSVDELWTDLALFLSDGSEDLSDHTSSTSLTIPSSSEDLETTPRFDTPPVRQSAVAPANDERQFFCRKSGERSEIGPVGLGDLQTEVNEGRLHPNDRVREAGSLCWIPCRELGAINFPAPETNQPAMPGDLLEMESIEPDEEDWREQASEPAVDSAAPEESTDWEEALFAPLEEDEPDVPTPDVAARVEDDPAKDAPSAEVEATPAGLTMISALVEEALDTPKASQGRRRTRGGRFRFPFAQLNSPLFYLLGALLIILAGIKLWPSQSGLYGEVLVDGVPLPVGSLVITPDSGSSRDGLSVGVVDGKFESAGQEELSPGRYEVLVTIGNPLGNPVPKLQSSPALAALNGAKLSTTIEFESGDEILMNLAGSDAVPLEDDGTSIMNIEGR